METPAEKWGKEKRINKICFIGRNLDREELTKAIYDCLETNSLRFKIGDKVECNVGEETWQDGEVIKLWDDCNAYRVKLDSGEEVWAPVDSDDFITPITQA